jgi:WD40 repeat protein
VNSGDDGLSLINSQTGAVSFVGRLDPNTKRYTTPVAMAVRPSDGELFVWNNSGDGIDANAATGVLLTVDPGTGQGTPVNSSTPPQGDIGALAFSPGGSLYGLADRFESDGEGGGQLVSDLVSVNPATGVKTLIGALGSGLRVAGADFSCGGVLYGVEINPFGTERLVTIDVATGTATVVATLSQDIGVIGSIVFHFGTLIGSADGKLFDINTATGAVSNVRSIVGGSSPQGLGTKHSCFSGPS